MPLYIQVMQGCGVAFIGFLLPCAAAAQKPAALPPVAFHASYDTYAAGIHVAEVETGFSFGPGNYQIDLGYHATGMGGFLFGGHQFDHVTGSWRGGQAAPSAFVEQSEWRGVDRRA